VTPYDRIVERASQAEKTIQAYMDRFLKNTRTGGILVLLVAVVLAFVFSRTVSKPLKLLAEGANRLGRGDLDVRVDIRSKDEFGRLGKLFNQVVPQLKERLQMGQSLELAREVQQNLLPRSAPVSTVFSMGGASAFCDGTGGDYYDFISFGAERPDCIGVIVGDVAGHGISSALLMTTARALIRQRSAMPGTIAAMVNDVNRFMVADVEDSGQFMTLFYACLDQRQCLIQWVCAGHDPAIVFDPEKGTFETLAGAGLPLGVLAEAGCRQYTKRLSPGMIIAMGTDGIWETRNVAGEMFGRQRFRQVIKERRKDSAPAIVAAVMAAVETFRSGAQQEDDATLAVIKVTPNVA
jgi:sigma-B regulation protein RsbU (phosphoserine phosphatase)